MSLRLYVYSMYVCVSVFLSVCPSVRLSVCPSVRLSVCPSVRLSVCPSVRLSVCPSVRLSVCPSVRLSVCPSVRLSVCPSVRLSVCPSVRLSVCPSVGLSVCRSEDRRMDGWMYVCLCVCVCDSFSHPKADCTWPPQWSPASSPNIARHARQPLPFWPQIVQIALEVLKLKSCNDTETVGEFDKNHESWRSKNGWMFYPLYPYKIYKVWGCMRHIISSLWGESAEDMNETLTGGETNPDSSKPSAVQILKIARSNGCLFNSTCEHWL